MSTYRLQLLDIRGDYSVPHGPEAYVALKTSSGISRGRGKSKGAFTVLTPQCLSLREFEGNVDNLIEELKTIKKQAKKFFERENLKLEKHRESRKKTD
jgi:hypothetical protein